MADFETRARKVLPPVLGHYTWLSIDRGEGSWLQTTDGRRVLDLTCGIAVTAVGHAHPRVVKAVTEQAQRLMHISVGVAKYESSIAFAEALATITPRGLDTAFFGNSGAEAIEGAIKLTRQTTAREAIITFRGGFHGRTVGAASLTTSKAQYKRGYGALLPEVYVAPFPYPLACALPDAHDLEACEAHCFAELEAMLEHEVPPEHVAAILIEPVLGEGGYVAAPASFLRRLRELATKIGALLVFDEVQTGMGRTGAWFAAQKVGVTPDVMTLAKALGGGMPLGAVVSSRERMERWRTGTHGSTFGGNPVSCAAGLATLQVIRDEGLVARAERLGEIMVEELAPLRSHPRLREIRRFGAMVAAEFDDKAVSKAAVGAALERDVLLITCGFHDQVVRFIPALNIKEDDLRAGMRTFVEAARAILVGAPA
ncbi:MAG: aminotransferase class III-fold pyridoxal phosphate-dependent enzyme [Chloroflexi bacterium]|nr:MAG: aminotransferase class III-fold pyridoxal phosphate-dependent enzyme [Chloroflexota bacterium]TMF24874.1 MAG: aminotransferase class III-fold pyridoxal phosphate-dependent enzyme [Chloroflexota bacterium]